MVDNLEAIKPLLKFPNPDDDYYFLQVLVRKKDKNILPFKIGGSNNNSRMIRPYYIRSIDSLENQWEEIKALCELFKGRAMIGLNRRSFKSSSLQMMVRLAQSIQSQNYNNQSMWQNVSGVYHPIKDKLWLVDIDNVEDKNDIEDAITNADPVGNKIVATIPSPNGWHLITQPFNQLQFKLEYTKPIDIHKNNPTNLYVP